MGQEIMELQIPAVAVVEVAELVQALARVVAVAPVS
jgi:hypothetical protein